MSGETTRLSPDLPLRSIQVQGYRAIRSLQLPRLGRVNLFVGQNNSGKTSFLEAVQLCASRSPRTVLASILRERSNFRPHISASNTFDETQKQVDAAVAGVQSLFYGSFSGSVSQPIRIGPLDGPDCLVISLPWADGAEATDSSASESGSTAEELFLGMDSPLVQLARDQSTEVLSLEWFLKRFGVLLTGTSQSTTFVPAQGFDRTRLSDMWDQAASAGYASAVEGALRSVSPELERIYLLGDPAVGGRSIALQLAGTTRPVPLTSMGDGTTRVFGLALACVRAKGGVLLIDEVENGLHRSVQLEVWDALFSLAERLDVQVFATTHGWEAVVGFQDAANRRAGDAMLYRLERTADGSLYAERYTKEEVALAAKHQIEVR